MGLMDLPAELISDIIAQSMAVRGYKRAVRLRLVNKFFAAEVPVLYAQLRILDDCRSTLERMGDLAVSYLSNRLLSNENSISPGANQIRKVARGLSVEDPNGAESYLKYIKSVCEMSQKLCKSTRMQEYFDPSPIDSSPGSLVRKHDSIHSFENRILSAAAYTNNLSLFKRVTNHDWQSRETGSPAQPYSAATLGSNLEVLDYLLLRTDENGEPTGVSPSEHVIRMWWKQVCLASEHALLPVLRHLLSYGWLSEVQEEHGMSFELQSEFYQALETPRVEIFEFLLLEKRKLKRRKWKLETKHLAWLLSQAAGHGWEEMTKHLLELGAPAHSFSGYFDMLNEPYIYWAGYRRPIYPLRKACHSGSEAVVNLLLKAGARPRTDELNLAVARGNMNMVKALVKHGAAVNSDKGHHPPVVVAVCLEHVEMFEFLIMKGARLMCSVGNKALERAGQDGLDSMLTLLKKHGVRIWKEKGKNKKQLKKERKEDIAYEREYERHLRMRGLFR